MTRRTQSAGGDFPEMEWDEDTWYPVFLNEIREINPVGSIGPKNQPRKNAAAKVVWATDDQTQAWIFDTISLTPSLTTEKKPSKCLAIMCVLAGKDPYNCGEPWIDDETLEFGFEQPGTDPAKWPVAGRITNGVKLQIRGDVTPGQDGRTFLRPDRYKAISAQSAPPAQAPPAAPPAQRANPSFPLSDDGQWEWNGREWQGVEYA